MGRIKLISQINKLIISDIQKEQYNATRRAKHANRTDAEKEQYRKQKREYAQRRKFACTKDMIFQREKSQTAYNFSDFQHSPKTEKLLGDFLAEKRILVKSHKEVIGEDGNIHKALD